MFRGGPEEPFWVGVFERIREGRVSVSKVTFGAEPKDYECLRSSENYDGCGFDPSMETVVKGNGINPQRMRRMAQRELQGTGIGTKIPSRH